MFQKIGFVGLGVMGKSMAKNLLKAGYTLVVYNRSRPALEELMKLGAAIASSPEDLARGCELVILSLPTGEDVMDVVLGGNGLIKSLASGGVVIDTSTIDPHVAAQIANEMKAKHCHLLDAPISGGPEGAERGTLSIMVGGEFSTFERCKEVLEKMGKSIFYLGDSGSGQKMKLINQVLCSGYFLVAADAYRLSKRLEVKEDDMLKVISKSWGDSPVFRHFLEVVASGQYADGARIGLYKKDLSIVSDIAKEERLSTPVIEFVRGYFLKASSLGHNNLDASWMHNLVEEIANSK